MPTTEYLNLYNGEYSRIKPAYDQTIGSVIEAAPGGQFNNGASGPALKLLSSHQAQYAQIESLATQIENVDKRIANFNDKTPESVRTAAEKQKADLEKKALELGEKHQKFIGEKLAHIDNLDATFRDENAKLMESASKAHEADRNILQKAREGNHGAVNTNWEYVDASGAKQKLADQLKNDPANAEKYLAEAEVHADKVLTERTEKLGKDLATHEEAINKSKAHLTEHQEKVNTKSKAPVHMEKASSKFVKPIVTAQQFKDKNFFAKELTKWHGNAVNGGVTGKIQVGLGALAVGAGLLDIAKGATASEQQLAENGQTRVGLVTTGALKFVAGELIGTIRGRGHAVGH